MADLWKNPNFAALLNQALQASASNQYHQVQSSITNTSSAFGQSIDAARSVLAASIPQPTGAFISNHAASTGYIKTTSKISLPPSLANKRKTKLSEIGSGSSLTDTPSSRNDTMSHQERNSSALPAVALDKNRYGESTVTCNDNSSGLPSSSMHSKQSTSNVLSAKTDLKEHEDTTTPVFSTEISLGKEFLVSKPEQPFTSILLEPSNTRNKLFPHGAHRILHDNDHWHKFILSGPVASVKDKVLKRILEQAEPTLLLPVMYREEDDKAVFFARNCGSAIERLCRNDNLMFVINGQTFVLRVLLQCAPINRLKLNALIILRKILEKRYNASDHCLDLSNFEHDPDLSPLMYCPLSQPSVLHFVLSSAITHPFNFSTLRLGYNGIRQLKIDVLVRASYLRNLDLSHNELLYSDDMKDLQELSQVTSLVLDGNPLCAEFRTSEEYICKFKSIMPQLKFLDAVSLFSGAIYVPKQKNFLCSKDGHQMVDQFLKHFYDRYDWKDRRCLDGLYHNSALFSLTCVHLSGQSTSDGSSLTWYSTYNRNLLRLSDYSKAEKNIYHGPDEILELFCSLPATEHDPFSFCVDLIHFSDKMAAVSVAGVFREHPTLPPQPDHMRSFRRIFVLLCTAPSEWQITNEQLHISNLTTEQAEASFKIKRPPIEAPVAAWLIQDAQLLSDAEKDQMSSIMMQLTTLSREWATRFLKDSHWYVREALIAFVNKFEAKELPEEAFARDV